MILRRQFVYISAVRCWIWSDVILWALNCIVIIEKYFTLEEKGSDFFTQWLLHFWILSNHFFKYKKKTIYLGNSETLDYWFNCRKAQSQDGGNMWHSSCLLLQVSLKYFDIRSLILLISRNSGSSLCVVAAWVGSEHFRLRTWACKH